MHIRGDGSKIRSLRRWLGHLVLFLFVGRALVPVGYMPDFASASKGVYRIVICAEHGPQAIDVDTNGHKIPGKPAVPDHQPCAFSGMAAIATPSFAELSIGPGYFIAAAVPTRVFKELPPVRAGPALGSRAPPHLS